MASKKKKAKKSGKKRSKKSKSYMKGNVKNYHSNLAGPIAKKVAKKVEHAIDTAVAQAMRAANKRGSHQHKPHKARKARKGSKSDVGAHMRASMKAGTSYGEKVTLASIAKKAGRGKTWVCQGPVRSGCGGGKARLSGARVSKRLKPCR